ncbi:transmembrane protein, putative (macronuclear) [Tetrahymena thermophila SB210]|uniref:Transmembrane protein, putative n=1 Tax=Tetrahymena thermophila (strain SB210) TaxID=312017 RepID=I7M1J8_TETTS|nr:transmembrane protein, putative [Tetrahymena thermophila SB210]EAR96479.2 transmembrane protein, putative [Tetrahymena thermophila SB210]|eukprot:XP_001016724.2 transmembrane protein, putative [Tetrahymena thermophila SB210]
MLIKYIKHLDIFSQPFSFDTSKNQLRKRTIVGAFLSLSVITAALMYFIYLTYMFFTNQMDPKFRSQIFITNDDVSFQLQDNLFAFAFKRVDIGVYLREIEAKESKTYLTYRGQYIYRNGTDIRFFNVSITNCQDPALKGFNCFDFSSLSNYSIAVGNINNVFSDLLIYVYRCQDTDIQYHPMPENCADPQEIEDYINLVTGVVQFKLYTQQYNTTSKEFEINYKNFYRLTSGAQMQLFDFKVQKQITKINQGLLLQSESVYSSPISYEEFEGSFDFQNYVKTTGQKYFNMYVFEVDEAVMYTQIQFPSFPEVLTLCNSAISLLMCLGFFGRFMANKLIKQNLFVTILQNYYQGTLEQMLQNNQLKQPFMHSDQLDDFTEQKDLNYSEDNKSPVQVPCLNVNSRQLVFSSSINQQTELLQQNNDEIKENNHLTFQIHEKYQQSDLLQNQKFEQKALQLIECVNQEKAQVKQELPIKLKDLKISESLTDNFTNPISSPVGSNVDKLLKFQSVRKKRKNSNEQLKLKNTEIQGNYCKKKTLEPITTNVGNIGQKIKSLKSQQIQKKVDSILFRFKMKKSKGLDPQIMKSISEQVDNSIDFLKFYQEMIFIKKAIMMILSEEQFAALQLVGCSDRFLKLIANKDISKINEEKMNHFEKQFAISLFQDIQIQNAQQFLKNCLNQEQLLNEIDQRIYSSLM